MTGWVSSPVRRNIGRRAAAIATTVVVLPVALLVVVLVTSQSADAAFPGVNGNIVFQSNRDTGAGDIYTIGPGGTVKRITVSHSSSDPAYSPDGRRIAFISSKPGGTYQVFVMNADGTGRTQVTQDNLSPTSKTHPTWAPDGKRIAFVANSFNVDGQTDLEIWVINADGTGLTQLTKNTVSDDYPAWSPRGDKIAFVSQGDVYVMNADGSGRTDLTPSSPPGCSPSCYQGGDGDPAWSPNGAKIAYVHGHTISGGGVTDIWTMDPNGANKVNVSNNNAVGFSEPAWSPDGTKIAMVGAADTNRDIWVMNANGTGQMPIDRSPAHDINPDWGPAPPPDTTPPNTTLVKGPSRRTTSRAATFKFKSNEPGSSFQCKLDNGKFKLCMSPKTYKRLQLGKHTFSVRGIDPAGNADRTPAKRSWTIVRKGR